MKKFVIILFFTLIFGIISCCINSTYNTDPIVGTWNYTSPAVHQLAIMRFYENGQVFASIGLKPDILIGYWKKNQDNTYNMINSENSSEFDVLVYDKNTDTLNYQMYPEVGYARGRAIYYGSYYQQATIRTTVVITTTTWVSRVYSLSWCQDHYPESTYNPSTDECEYDGVSVWATTTKTRTLTPTRTITRTPTKTPTKTLTQNNYQYCSDTYPGSYYNPSTNKCVFPTTLPTKIPTAVLTKTSTQGYPTSWNNLVRSDISFAPGRSVYPGGSYYRKYFYDSSVSFTIINTGSTTNRDNPAFRGRMYDNNDNFVPLTITTYTVGTLEPRQSEVVTLSFHNGNGDSDFSDSSWRMEIVEMLKTGDGQIYTYQFTPSK